MYMFEKTVFSQMLMLTCNGTDATNPEPCCDQPHCE